MHLQRFLCPAVKASKFLCLAALSLTILSTSVLSASSAEAVPNGELARIFSRQELETGSSFSSDGFTDAVQWDSYSLIVKGQRIFLQCVHSLNLHTLEIYILTGL